MAVRRHRKSLNFKLQKESSRKKESPFHIILNDLIVVFAAIVLGYFAVTFLVQTVTMNDRSMTPEISEDDVLLVNKLTYRVKSIQRGDVVVIQKIYQTESENSATSSDSSVRTRVSDSYDVKRVVGIPGDEISVVGGKLAVNDTHVADDLPYSNIENPGQLTEPVTLGDDEYFVIGDNPEESEDSRFINFGTLSKTEITGKVTAILLPKSHRRKVRSL